MFETGVHKTTLLWTNCKGLADSLASHAFECCEKYGRTCLEFRLNRRHQERASQGDGKTRSELAAFPRDFARHVALLVNAEVAGKLAGA